LRGARQTGVDCPADNVAKNISCFGGAARLLSKINEVKESVNDSIVLNAGDEWQGT
jgi:2',3'-cyclic-nucleotide 2'-phosphodiesterase (5'-nucleotidase family)